MKLPLAFLALMAVAGSCGRPENLGDTIPHGAEP
jgi:hypothetical protein